MLPPDRARRRDELLAAFGRKVIFYIKNKAQRIVRAAERPMPKWLEFTPDESSVVEAFEADPARFRTEMVAERDELYGLLRDSGVDPDAWLLAQVEAFRIRLGELQATPGIEQSTAKH